MGTRDSVFAERPNQRVVLAGYQDPTVFQEPSILQAPGNSASGFQAPPTQQPQAPQSSLNFPSVGDDTRSPANAIEEPPAEAIPDERVPNDSIPQSNLDDEAAPAPPAMNNEQVTSPFPQRSGIDSEDAPEVSRREDPAERDDSFEDCEQVRSRALADDIANVRLDTAPEFPVGGDKEASPRTKQDAFVQKAPTRAWYDSQGRFVVDAKLVDLVNEHVVLKSSSGATQRIHLHELSDADLVYVAEVWGLPVSCTLGPLSPTDRDFVPSTVHWRASGLCHKPLYFEDVQLERYGHEVGPVMQPIISTARFFGDVVTMPYKMGIHPMNECQYSLGYYRPGSCAPWTMGPIPISLRGGLFQAAAVTGVVGAVP